MAVDKKPMTFTAWPSNTPALRELAGTPDVARLLWFTSGFMGAREVKGQLVLSDLRMGAEPDYTFQYGVAQRLPSGAWQATEPQKVGGFRNAREQLGRAWGRGGCGLNLSWSDFAWWAAWTERPSVCTDALQVSRLRFSSIPACV